MKKRKWILSFLVVLIFLCFLGVVFYLVTKENDEAETETETTETSSTGLEPEASSRLVSEYEEFNALLKDKIDAEWADERPDDYGFPYVLKTLEGTVGYLCLDLDGDTVQELLIGEMTDLGFVIYGIYTGSAKGEKQEVWVCPGFYGMLLSEEGILVYENDAKLLLEDSEEEMTGFRVSHGELELCKAPNPFVLMELPEFVPVSTEQEEETVLDADDAMSR